MKRQRIFHLSFFIRHLPFVVPEARPPARACLTTKRYLHAGFRHPRQEWQMTNEK